MRTEPDIKDYIRTMNISKKIIQQFGCDTKDIDIVIETLEWVMNK